MVEVREVKNISVELAIRRELAYRKKVAAFLSEKEIAALLPLEVPTQETQDDQLPLLAFEGPKTEDEVEYNESDDDQVPLLALEGPKFEDGVEIDESDDQVPLLALEGPKTEDEVEDIESDDQVPLLALEGPKSEDEVEISESVLPSTSNTFQNHSRRPHSTLNWTNSTANDLPPSASDFRPSRSPSARSLGFLPRTGGSAYFCNLCKVDCTSSFNYKNHKRGHKHKAKLKYRQLMSNKKNKHRHFFCEVCEIWCGDEGSLQVHLDGRKHMVKLHKAESADHP